MTCAAASAEQNAHFAVGVAAVNGGIVAPGFGIYTPSFEAGIDGSMVNYSGKNTLAATGWGGLRRPINGNFNMTLGASFTGVFSSSESNFYSISPYIGFDIMHLMSAPGLLGAWLNPVSWNKISGDSNSEWVFGSGGIKLAYLF